MDDEVIYNIAVTGGTCVNLPDPNSYRAEYACISRMYSISLLELTHTCVRVFVRTHH